MATRCWAAMFLWWFAQINAGLTSKNEKWIYNVCCIRTDWQPLRIYAVLIAIVVVIELDAMFAYKLKIEFRLTDSSWLRQRAHIHHKLSMRGVGICATSRSRNAAILKRR